MISPPHDPNIPTAVPQDCAEAHEKLLRLPLKGDQRREVVRVLVECCLAEKSWNPYYPLLALRLCGGGGGGEGGGGGGTDSLARAHRVTTQYCLWDRFKETEVCREVDGQGWVEGVAALPSAD